MIEYHIYIYLSKFKTPFSKQISILLPYCRSSRRLVLMVTNCSTLDGARQALLGVTVFPAILKTLSDLELLELQRQSVPCGREEEIGFRASSTKAAGRLHCLHLATVRSSSTPFQTCSAAKFSLRNFFTTLLEGTRLLDF